MKIWVVHLELKRTIEVMVSNTFIFISDKMETQEDYDVSKVMQVLSLREVLHPGLPYIKSSTQKPDLAIKRSIFDLKRAVSILFENQIVKD